MQTDVSAMLARLRKTDADAANAAKPATEWLVGEDGALSEVSLMRLCEFLWYALPRKFLTPLDDHIAIAKATGRLFREAGMSHHADLCESPTTIQVLRAWEAEPDAGFTAYQAALNATGVVPADVPELVWGDMMGMEESDILDRVSMELEKAVIDGRLQPGTPSFERRRRSITSAALARSDSTGGRSRRQVVERERISMWPSRGGDLRRRVAGAMTPLIAEPVSMPAGAEANLAGLRWLLDRAASGGLPLTEKHNLARSVVGEAAAQFPTSTLRVIGPARNESDVLELNEGRLLLQAIGAVRRRARRLLVTPRGRELLQDATTLWRAATCALIQTGKGRDESRFGAACQEAELLLLSTGDRVAPADLSHAVLEIVLHQGWTHEAGGPVTRDDVAWFTGDIYRRLVMLDLFVDGDRSGWGVGYQLTPIGVAAALTALRQRAIQPMR